MCVYYIELICACCDKFCQVSSFRQDLLYLQSREVLLGRQGRNLAWKFISSRALCNITCQNCWSLKAICIFTVTINTLSSLRMLSLTFTLPHCGAHRELFILLVFHRVLLKLEIHVFSVPKVFFLTSTKNAHSLPLKLPKGLS